MTKMKLVMVGNGMAQPILKEIIRNALIAIGHEMQDISVYPEITGIL